MVSTRYHKIPGTQMKENWNGPKKAANARHHVLSLNSGRTILNNELNHIFPIVNSLHGHELCFGPCHRPNDDKLAVNIHFQFSKRLQFAFWLSVLIVYEFNGNDTMANNSIRSLSIRTKQIVINCSLQTTHTIFVPTPILRI